MLAAAPAAALEPPYFAAYNGARCNLEPSGSLTCRYRVGADLEFLLKRVAERDVRLEILRSSPAGDYYVEPKLVDRCAAVRHGRRGVAGGGFEHSYALISGKNGLVYQSLRECRLSK
ncbi:MAG TPA: hypothetical protein VJN20_02650 [Burkholderiales bacterium]|nr:hypothetical protein [Burkholderiales bacterium]